MQEREDEPLQPGTGYHLVKALLDLNRYMERGDLSPLVEVVVMSRRLLESASITRLGAKTGAQSTSALCYIDV